jgi:hypothetical protein
LGHPPSPKRFPDPGENVWDAEGSLAQFFATPLCKAPVEQLPDHLCGCSSPVPFAAHFVYHPN